jgi:hypothetical protein
MDATTSSPQSKTLTRIGLVITAIPILMMGVLGLVMAVAFPQKITEGMGQYGYSAAAAKGILIAEIACVILYAIPRTAILGAILLTGYLGGAVATHVRAGEMFVLPVAMGVLVWLGLVLRDPKLRALLPLRRGHG